jgi:hypothetical protein
MPDTIDCNVLSKWLRNSSKSTVVYDEENIDIWVTTPCITSLFRIYRPALFGTKWDCTLQITTVRGFEVCLECAPLIIDGTYEWGRISFLWDKLLDVTNNPNTHTLRDVLSDFGIEIEQFRLKSLCETSDRFEKSILDRTRNEILDNYWEVSDERRADINKKYNATLTPKQLEQGYGLITLITDAIEAK